MDRLVREADVLFMLTDSRESRWLPSMLAAAHGTLLINAALGFDSWIVMRHGHTPDATLRTSTPDSEAATAACADGASGSGTGAGSGAAGATAAADGTGTGGGGGAGAPPDRLGCYFCNDVVAPANSASGRSMDEQCTVVRPGLARIAAAHAVEMLAALSQHAAWAATPPLASDAAVAVMGGAAGSDAGPALGGVPHMLRGCLTGFSQTHMTGTANTCCSACSRAVVQAYRKGGAAFVTQVLQVRPSQPLCLGSVLALGLRSLLPRTNTRSLSIYYCRAPGT